ncbi:MAG: AsnC family transcriptional regulator [Acidimicrobiales bacterium]|nr:AsnC family transcriptional regulator [Acidimicrobiales bacterium]
MISAFVLIKAVPDQITALADALVELDGVAEVYSVAGDVDLVVIVRVRHHDDLAEIVTGSIATQLGIVETRTMIAYKAYSRHDLDAMWDLGSPG